MVDVLKLNRKTGKTIWEYGDKIAAIRQGLDSADVPPEVTIPAHADHPQVSILDTFETAEVDEVKTDAMSAYF